jgi:two-component system chemotaxis response regulator CheY
MSLNVLVVDDSPVMRKVVRRSLGMCGLPVGEIHEAGNGLEALAVLARCWVDLVVADINMPEMNGVEMVEKMAEDQLIARIPVVMVTSERSEARIERLRQLGVRGYLTKPFRPEALRDLVNDLLPIEGALKMEPTPALLCETAAATLEECVFMVAQPSALAPVWPREVVRATIGFDGPLRGILGIVTTVELAEELALSMMGTMSGATDAAAEGALAELANIVGGVLVERLFGREATVHLGLPAVARDLGPPTGGITATLLDEEGRAIGLTLDLGRPAPRSIHTLSEVP